MIRAIEVALVGCLGAVACTPATARNAAPGGAEDAADVSAVPDPPESLAPVAPSAAPAPGCVAHASLAGHSTWFFFTRPDRPCRGAAGSGVDMNAIDELTRLIGTVPAGERIDGHLFSISVDAVAKALLDAQTRGVEVRVSMDGGVASSTDAAKTKYLDKLEKKVYCTSSNNRSCISTAEGAISHTKLFTFTPSRNSG